MRRVLLSAFAFAPDQGSEAGGAWRWAIALSRDHQVVVVTDVSRRSKVEPTLEAQPVENLEVIYYRPWVARFLPVNSKTAQIVFGIWQLGLPLLVRSLDRKWGFDYLHHISYGVFRQASWLGLLGKPFVFGPVGGAEDAPWRLKRSFPVGEKARELLRSLANWLAIRNPAWVWAVSAADLVISRTEETRRALPSGVRERAVVAQEIGAPTTEIQPARPFEPGHVVELLFVGRLLGLKGIHLAIRAVARLKKAGRRVRLTVIGSGPMGKYLTELACAVGVERDVSFVARIPQADLFRRYASAHVFLFPSLRESGGNVVLEALSAGLPVVCCDLGGPRMFVDSTCGYVANASSCRDEEHLVAMLAEGVAAVSESPEVWWSYHLAALRRARDLSVERQFSAIQQHISRMLDARRDAARLGVSRSGERRGRM